MSRIPTRAARGVGFGYDYIANLPGGTTASNKLEAPAYLWGSWIHYFHRYGDPYPWYYFKRA